MFRLLSSRNAIRRSMIMEKFVITGASSRSFANARNLLVVEPMSIFRSRKNMLPADIDESVLQMEEVASKRGHGPLKVEDAMDSETDSVATRFQLHTALKRKGKRSNVSTQFLERIEELADNNIDANSHGKDPMSATTSNPSDKDSNMDSKYAILLWAEGRRNINKNADIIFQDSNVEAVTDIICVQNILQRLYYGLQDIQFQIPEKLSTAIVEIIVTGHPRQYRDNYSNLVSEPQEDSSVIAADGQSTNAKESIESDNIDVSNLSHKHLKLLRSMYHSCSIVHRSSLFKFSSSDARLIIQSLYKCNDHEEVLLWYSSFNVNRLSLPKDVYLLILQSVLAVNNESLDTLYYILSDMRNQAVSVTSNHSKVIFDILKRDPKETASFAMNFQLERVSQNILQGNISFDQMQGEVAINADLSQDLRSVFDIFISAKNYESILKLWDHVHEDILRYLAKSMGKDFDAKRIDLLIPSNLVEYLATATFALYDPYSYEFTNLVVRLLRQELQIDFSEKDLNSKELLKGVMTLVNRLDPNPQKQSKMFVLKLDEKDIQMTPELVGVLMTFLLQHGQLASAKHLRSISLQSTRSQGLRSDKSPADNSNDPKDLTHGIINAYEGMTQAIRIIYSAMASTISHSDKQMSSTLSRDALSMTEKFISEMILDDMESSVFAPEHLDRFPRELIENIGSIFAITKNIQGIFKLYVSSKERGIRMSDDFYENVMRISSDEIVLQIFEDYYQTHIEQDIQASRYNPSDSNRPTKTRKLLNSRILMKAIDILIKRKEQHIITSLIDDLKKNHVLISSDVSLRLVQKFNAVGLYKYTIAIIDILFNLNQRRRVIPAHIHGSIYSSLIFIAMEACAMARTPDKAIEIFSLDLYNFQLRGLPRNALEISEMMAYNEHVALAFATKEHIQNIPRLLELIEHLPRDSFVPSKHLLESSMAAAAAVDNSIVQEYLVRKYVSLGYSFDKISLETILDIYRSRLNQTNVMNAFNQLMKFYPIHGLDISFTDLRVFSKGKSFPSYM